MKINMAEQAQLMMQYVPALGQHAKTDVVSKYSDLMALKKTIRKSRKEPKEKASKTRRRGCEIPVQLANQKE